jgi:hypothetical protein
MNQLRACAGLAAALLLTGCTAARAAQHPASRPAASGPAAGSPARTDGHVTGRLLIEGGPMGPGGQQPGPRPIPGTVTFTMAGHRSVSAEVGASGKFSAWLPPGRYRVTGRSPDIETVTSSGKTVEQTCSQPVSVTVSTRHAATVTLVCAVP